MNRAMAMAAGIVCLTLCGLALGQAAPKQSLSAQPRPEPAAAPADVPESVRKLEETVLADLSCDQLPLEEMILHLQQRVPGFNAVIVRNGVAGDYPTLPNMHLKNVTMGQFMQFLKTSFAGLDTMRIDGPTGPVYVIRINPPAGGPRFQPFPVMAPAGFGGPQVPGMAPGGFGGPPGAPASDQPHVKVYYLADILASLRERGGRKDDGLNTLNDVASLISQTLDEVPEKMPSEIKVHGETRTLIFKGGPEKMAVLEQLLQALTPQSDPAKQKLEHDLRQLKMEFGERLDAAKITQGQTERRLAEANDEITALRTRMAQKMTATTRP